jgi:stage III sporulation protein AH
MAVIIWRRKRSMNAKWKRNAVVATMMVLVGSAVLLNWKYSGQNAIETVEETGTKILGEATLVSGQEHSDGTPESEETVYTGGDYFASARLTR